MSRRRLERQKRDKEADKLKKLKEKLTRMKENPKVSFLISPEWVQLRYCVMSTYGARCMKCQDTGVTMNVDHILPRSTYPEKSLDFFNLQVLCQDCNYDKSNTDTTDYRIYTNIPKIKPLLPNLSLNFILNYQLNCAKKYHEPKIYPNKVINSNVITRKNTFFSKKLTIPRQSVSLVKCGVYRCLTKPYNNTGYCSDHQPLINVYKKL